MQTPLGQKITCSTSAAMWEAQESGAWGVEQSGGTTYVAGASWEIRGRPSELLLGNGTTQAFEYEAGLFLELRDDAQDTIEVFPCHGPELVDCLLEQVIALDVVSASAWSRNSGESATVTKDAAK